MINKTELHQICNMEQRNFARYGKMVETPGYSFYIHIDRGSNVLGVAHLDTVQDKRNFRISKGKVYSPRLDDRLGVYIILKMLPAMGVKTDVLLTTDEEFGMSTAEHFQTEKQYNWMYSFDRAGSDVVMYQYETVDYTDLLNDYGFWDIGWGSYSDLCELGHLGVMGVNIGTGYENYHSTKAFALLSTVRKNVNRFASFYHDTKDIFFEHTGAVYARYSSIDDDRGYGLWKGENYWNGEYYCKTCGLSYIEWPTEQKSMEYYGYCTSCLAKQEAGLRCTVCGKDCSKDKYDRYTWIDHMMCEGCCYDEALRKQTFEGWEDADYT